MLRLSDFGGTEIVEDQQTIVPLGMKRHEIGSTGTRVDAGYPSEEYLATLRGTDRADIFDEMRRSDAQLVMCLKAVKNPILGATWEIHPGCADGEAPSPEAIEDAKLIKHILIDDLDRPFKKFLGEVLTFIDFGHAAFEITHKIALDHPRFGSYNGLQSLGWRSPRTIERWNINKDTGKLASITQIAEGDLDKGMVNIPDQFLLTFSLNQEGSNYEGISMLRPCYGPWMRKDLYLKLNAIGIEKSAVGTPIVEIPPGKENSPELTNMVSALEKYVSHESGYLMFPSGWKINLNSNDYDPTKVEESIDREDRRMAKAFLANFLELGMGSSGGAYALSNDLSDFMLSGLEHVADEIASPINMDLIPSLVKINRGPRDFYPVLKHSGISDKAGQELATMLKALGDGKWLTPEDGDEDHLRKRMGLPARTGQGVRDTAPSPFGGAFSERFKMAEKARLRGSRA
jgi:hypothetical protein